MDKDHRGFTVEQAIVSKSGDRPATEDSAKVPEQNQRMSTIGERLGEVDAIGGLKSSGDAREVRLLNIHLSSPWE